MNKSYVPRALLVAIGALYMANHLVMGLYWLPFYNSLEKPQIAFALYMMASAASLFFGNQVRMPMWLAANNLIVTIVIPWLVLSEFPIENYSANGSYATWFIGGLGSLMAVTMLRRQALFAWVGLGVMELEVIRWGGPGVIATSGLIGALLLVSVCFAVSRGLENTSRLTQEYLTKASQVAAKTATNTAARTERQRFLLSGFAAALPMLETIVARDGNLDEVEKREVRLVQAKLTDEIRGRKLLNPAVQVAAREARLRGVEVTIIDEGGIDDVGEQERHELLTSVAEAIGSTVSGKIHIRAPKGESYRINIVATRPEASGPDLWLRLS